MQWEFVIALALAIPVVLFPAAYIWYLTAGGLGQMIREASRGRTAAQGKRTATR